MTTFEAKRVCAFEEGASLEVAGGAAPSGASVRDGEAGELASVCSGGGKLLLLTKWRITASAKVAGGWLPILSCNHRLSTTLPKLWGRGLG